MPPNYTVIGGKLDQGKRYPERFERRVIRICMGNNELSDGV
jgi:hypothetical protein